MTKDTEKSKVILVTSSIKGEGKTVVSTHLSKIISFSKKAILIGSDLRNPQIHKFTKVNKTVKGLSDYIFERSTKLNEIINKNGSLDIIYSGPIPPNPTEMLASERFTQMVDLLKEDYDYILIDSAPCLLVADTLQFSSIVDTSILVIRANHTNFEVLKFINELKDENKLNNIHIVLNGIGNSSIYGYKYNYQYGYKYGYSYNYGYGYGYGS